MAITKQSQHPGRQIPWPDQKHNCLSLEYTRAIVSVCNAILNLRVKGGEFLISDNNALLLLDQVTGGSSGGVPGLPWQISSVSDGVIQVSAGVVIVRPELHNDAYSFAEGIYEAAGTATNITLPAPASVYPIWLKVYNPGSPTAEVQTEATATYPPATWFTAPYPQGFDGSWPNNDYSVGFVLLGYVNTAVSPNVIVQYVYDNPGLVDISNNMTAIRRGPWDSGETYRMFSDVVTHGGSTYIRQGNLSASNNGGTPGVSADWQLW